jgi:hypothetical protein
VTPEEERLAEALAVERIHGDEAPDHVFERVKALAEAGDMDGVKRWMEIGEWLDRLQQPEGPVN